METKLKPNDAIVMMLQALNDDKKERAYEIAQSYAETTSRNGNFYYRAIRLIKQRPIKMMLKELKGDVSKLISEKDYSSESVYIDSQTQDLINGLLTEWENKELFRSHNLGVRNKLLLHGPTGNGKTTIARHIAKIANLPFVEVNSDLMIDSHLGCTGKNINAVFSSIQESCVLFWDEIDTIGKKRSSSNLNSADFENDRIVNSILLNIEKLDKDVIFIGATNRMDVLDPAFLRRFDVKYEIGAPTLLKKSNFAQMLAEYYHIPETHIPDNLESYESFSEIKSHMVDMARRHVLELISNR